MALRTGADAVSRNAAELAYRAGVHHLVCGAFAFFYLHICELSLSFRLLQDRRAVHTGFRPYSQDT